MTDWLTPVLSRVLVDGVEQADTVKRIGIGDGLSTSLSTDGTTITITADGADPSPSDVVTTTDATPVDIGNPIDVPASSTVDIDARLIGREVASGDLVVVRRLLTLERGASGPCATAGASAYGTDIVSAAATGSDFAGTAGATSFQLQVQGPAGISIKWRMFIVGACVAEDLL